MPYLISVPFLCSYCVQIIVNHSIAAPLKELRRLIKLRVGENRDIVGYNLAAFRAIARVANANKNKFGMADEPTGNDIWANLGVGSDVVAAVSGRSNDKKRLKMESQK
jgi:hypothetical protein